MTLLALLAGTGLGFALGLVYGLHISGKALPKQFDFLTTTVDKLTASALYPGLKGIVDTQIQQPQESMYVPEEADPVKLPDWLREEDDQGPWDYTGGDE